MIEVNQPARRYESRLNMASGATRSGSSLYARASSLMDFNWGLPIGAKATLRNEYPDFTPGPGEHRAELIIPVLGVHEYRPIAGPGVGWLSAFNTRFNLTDFQLTLTGCDKFALAGKLEWYVNYGAGEILEYTIDLTGIEGKGFNPVYNSFFFKPEAAQGESILEVAPPNCTTLVPRRNTVTNNVTAGWRHYPGGVATNKTIDIKSLSPPPVSSCGCETDIATLSATDSWTIMLEAYEDYWQRREEVGEGVCICAGTVSTIGLRFTIYKHIIELIRRGSEIRALPNDAALLHSITTRRSNCYHSLPIPLPNEVITDTNPEATTYAPYKRDGARTYVWAECTESVRGSPCPINAENPDGSPPNIDVCFDGDEFACAYNGSVELELVAPSCSGSTSPSNHVSRRSKLYKCEVDSSGNIIVYRSDYSSPPYAGHVSITSLGGYEEPRLMDDIVDRLWCTFARFNAGAYSGWYSRSNDNGRTWSSLVASGIAGARHLEIAGGISGPELSGDIVIGAFVYNSGTSGWGRIKTEKWAKGATGFAAPVTAQYWNGSAYADIEVEDSQFGISQEQGTAKRWILSVIIRGETSSSDWWCADDTLHTWKRFT